MMGLPQVVTMREVGTRDGIQSLGAFVPTEQKIEMANALARTGLTRLEVTSFVRADVIPQLADGPEVLTGADIPDQVAVSVLVPNERGLENALALRGHFTTERRLGVQINGLYWQFVVIVWIPLYLLLYWVPRT